MVISFKIEKELKEALLREAAKQHRTLSGFIIHTLKLYLEKEGIEYELKKGRE